MRASNRGVSAARNVSGGPNWSFGQSLFFSSTVVTTIGYYLIFLMLLFDTHDLFSLNPNREHPKRIGSVVTEKVAIAQMVTMSRIVHIMRVVLTSLR